MDWTFQNGILGDRRIIFECMGYRDFLDKASDALKIGDFATARSIADGLSDSVVQESDSHVLFFFWREMQSDGILSVNWANLWLPTRNT